ncbi:MAG: transposase [Verrucomicrobiaceae bacterium]|nr:transposase [Verrucomicrobiaceae bacterium]
MPSAAVIDSQSVKGGQLPAVSCGYDAGKKIKGRKRHALTDTNGLLLGVVVTPADVQDRDGAKLLLYMFCHSFMSLLISFADEGYAGNLKDQKGVIILTRRWVIERSFGWLVKATASDTRSPETPTPPRSLRLSCFYRHHDTAPHHFTVSSTFCRGGSYVSWCQLVLSAHFSPSFHLAQA